MPIFAYQFDNSSRKVINIFWGRCLKAIIALAFVTAVLPERKKNRRASLCYHWLLCSRPSDFSRNVRKMAFLIDRSFAVSEVFFYSLVSEDFNLEF